MWPLLEHPGQTQPQNLFCLATSWSSLSKHRSAFQLLKSYPKRANSWDSQLKLIPAYPQVRSGIGSPTRPCKNPRAHFAKPGSWEHGQVVLPAAGLAPFRSVPPAETRSGCTSLLCSLPTQLRLPFQQPPEEKSHPPGTNATIYRHQQSEWRIRKGNSHLSP